MIQIEVIFIISSCSFIAAHETGSHCRYHTPLQLLSSLCGSDPLSPLLLLSALSFSAVLYSALLWYVVLTFRGLLPSPLPLLRDEHDSSEVENKEPLHASCPSTSTLPLQNGRIKGGIYLLIYIVLPSMRNRYNSSDSNTNAIHFRSKLTNRGLGHSWDRSYPCHRSFLLVALGPGSDECSRSLAVNP